MYLRLFGLLLGLFFCQLGFSTIYGNDDRLLLHQVKNQELTKIADSAMAKIPRDRLQFDSDLQEYSVTPDSEKILCSSEKFSDQPMAADCSGFLISEKLVLTAGHCLKDGICDSHHWVFGYNALDDDTRKKTNKKQGIKIAKEDVYTCTAVHEYQISSYSKKDYAIFELDREVVKQTPLALNRTGQFEKKDELVLIGYPLGIPTTIAPMGKVLQNNNPYIFTMKIDGFAGNSGSMVINATTKQVEGVFQYGDGDLIADKKQNCKKYKNCGVSGCQGEQATRVSAIPFINGQHAPFEPEMGRYTAKTFLKERFSVHPELRFFDMVGFCLNNWPDADCFEIEEIHSGR